MVSTRIHGGFEPICRLRFNHPQKLRLGIFKDNKDEDIVALDAVDNIFDHIERLKATVLAYIQNPESGAE